MSLMVVRDGDRNDAGDLLVGGGFGGEDGKGVARYGHGEGLAGDHVDADIGDDALHAELGDLAADVATGEAAGVIGLILNPEGACCVWRLQRR